MPGGFFYTLLLSITSGIFLRSFFVIGWVETLWVLLVAVGLGLWWYRNRKAEKAHVVLITVLILSGLALGIGRYNVMLGTAPPYVLQAQIDVLGTYEGQVVREPELQSSSASLVVQIGRERVLVKTDRHTNVQYGDTVRVTGTLALPETFITDTGRSFDYPGYLRTQGIGYMMSFTEVAVLDTTTGSPILRFLFTGKSQFINGLQAVLPEPQAGLGIGLLLGVKHTLGDELETIFRRAGIIHIVVLSGYNIMLIVGFVMLILARLFSLRVRVVIGVIAIVGFALVVGLGASVVRASIMATLGLVALFLGRRYAVLRALFLAGTVMVVVNPYILVHDVGFQLSFMATLGLLLVAPLLESKAGWLPTKFGFREFLLATVATQIAVLPILLYSIGEFSIIALVVNVLVLPVVPIAMLLTFCTGLISLGAPAVAVPFSVVTYGALGYIISTATIFSALPFAVVTVKVFPVWGIPVFYAGLALLVYLFWLRRTRVGHVPLLASDSNSTKGWTVVEEKEVAAPGPRVPKTGSAVIALPARGGAKSVDPETPIFFRD